MIVTDIRRQFYERLLPTGGNPGRVLVLVSYDVDGICAVKILQRILHATHVQYTIIGVATRNQLIATYQQHRDVVKRIILINLGAIFDVWEELRPAEDLEIFIADTQRPISIWNYYRDVRVHCIIDDEELPTIEERIPASDQLFRDDDDPEEEDVDIRQLSTRELERRQEYRRWKERRKDVLWEYEQRSYFGYSTSYTFFKLAWKLNKDTSTLLWLAIVGVQDQHINGKLDPELHDILSDSLKHHMNRINRTRGDVGNRSLNGTSGAGLSDGTNIDRNGSSSVRDNRLVINYTKDLMLTMYRHWTVFDSLRHTKEVACHFKLWSRRGESRMLEFLAQLGVPLIQCRQRYANMDIFMRKHMISWIEELLERTENEQLNEAIIGHTFVATRGFRARLSGTDVALAVRALLESTDKNKTRLEKFVDATDALDWKDFKLLDEGFRLARRQLQAIFKQVHDIVEMRQTHSAGPFLYVMIREGAPDLTLFSHPGSLRALAHFARAAYTETRKRDTKRGSRALKMPFVLIAPDVHQKGWSYAVGIPAQVETESCNFFGKAFEYVAEISQIEIHADLANYCTIRFPTDDHKKLIDRLTDILS